MVYNNQMDWDDHTDQLESTFGEIQTAICLLELRLS